MCWSGVQSVGCRCGTVDLVSDARSNLRPFVKGDGRAVEAGRRSAESRAERRKLERAAAADVLGELRTLAGLAERADLGPVAVAAALDAIGRVQRGEWSVRDPADWVRVLVDVARLEAGEATSASIVAHVGRDAAAGVMALRDQARAALDAGSSSTAQAAADGVVASPVLDLPVGGSDEAST